MDAIITDIQRFSLNDGPGIRTTVFFKGCNMGCKWCHNPETISISKDLLFYPSKCIGCGHCFTVCPVGAHTLTKDNQHAINRNICIECGECANQCYAEALVNCGRKMNVEQVMSQIIQDKAYYTNSGGGVTLSGGEVLMQRDFAIELTDACHASGIKVAVETNMNFPFDWALPLLSKVDYIMCDIKIFDGELHEKYTKVRNLQILNNIKVMDKLNIPFIVRTPLIPGATDSDGNISQISEYISTMKNLQRYELLNFNPLGADKYKGLDKNYAYYQARPLSAERLSELKDIAMKNVPNVKVV